MIPQKKKPYMMTTALVAVICLCFLGFSLLFLVHMTLKNNEDSLAYLRAAAQQAQTAVRKQIAGDFQTLEGIAICIGDIGLQNEAQVMDILKVINDRNSFVRMGLATPDGKVDLLDVDGSYYQDVDVSRQAHFLGAMDGKSTITVAIRDRLSDAYGYINCYGIPVYHEGTVAGVLCATNTAATLREIIDAPVLYGSGFSSIIDSAGGIVIRSLHPDVDRKNVLALEDLGEIAPEVLSQVLTALQNGESGQFSFGGEQDEQIAVFEPIGINDWYILSVVPSTVLKQQFSQAAVGMMTIIVCACIIFLFLLSRERQLMAKNQEALMKLAYVDPLTGCRNFNKFLLDAEALPLRDPARKFAVWYCDLKRFKYFNDVFGYHTGDQLLTRLADLFRSDPAPDSLFCRVSADNFCGARPYGEKDELIRWFQDLQARLSQEELGTNNRLHIDICMGFYCVDSADSALSVNDMVNRANMAQKSVKTLSGSQAAFFSSTFRDRMVLEAEMEARERHALDAGQFVVYCQPKVNIQKGGEISGAEALVRWNRPGYGLVPPNVFIPLFEKNGFIVQLDRYIFEEVCKWFRGYLAEGRPPLNLAVNVSRLGLLQEDFVDYYAAVKETYGIPDQMLELEFTESVILEDNQLFHDTVIALQQRGFICSMDDFGAGYSSLNVLKNLPIDVLKLDILFFREGTDIGRERVVIENIIHMARQLQMKTIAEGVETVEQIEFLQKAGCDVVQGYIFSKPLPLDAFDALLRQYCGRPMPFAEHGHAG